MCGQIFKQFPVKMDDIYCGMYVSLSDGKHQFVQDNSKSALEIQDKFSPRQNAV